MTVRTAMKRKPAKIARWVKYTYRIFLEDGASKYLAHHISQLEGQTNEDTKKYLVKHFQELLGYDKEVQKVKLISVDGEKYNIMIT